jgi:hypothetical protein
LSVASCSTAAAAFSRSHLLFPDASTCANCFRSSGSDPPAKHSAGAGGLAAAGPPAGGGRFVLACAVCTGDRSTASAGCGTAAACMEGLCWDPAVAAVMAAAATGAAVLLLSWLLCEGDMLASRDMLDAVLAASTSFRSGMSCSRCSARVAAACSTT